MTSLAVEKIHQILANQAGATIEEVRANPKLADIGFDSLDVIEATMAIEDDLAIRIDDAKINSDQTVEEFIAVFIEQLAQAPL